jgi:hypothetical protein
MCRLSRVSSGAEKGGFNFFSISLCQEKAEKDVKTTTAFQIGIKKPV